MVAYFDKLNLVNNSVLSLNNSDKQGLGNILTLSDLLVDPIMLSSICASLISIKDLMGVSYGTCLCPFHDDYHHRSAKVYQDTDGVSRLYCFGRCNKQYHSYHYIKKVLRKNPYYYLIENFGTDKLTEMVKSYNPNIQTSELKKEFVTKIYDELMPLKVYTLDKNEQNDLIREFIDRIYIGK